MLVTLGTGDPHVLSRENDSRKILSYVQFYSGSYVGLLPTYNNTRLTERSKTLDTGSSIQRCTGSDLRVLRSHQVTYCLRVW